MKIGNQFKHTKRVPGFLRWAVPSKLLKVLTQSIMQQKIWIFLQIFSLGLCSFRKNK